uniref:EGF-like domain-containing protein n=1 Tax=Acrobeloides nanus TaxID=290746 RepID=A0A914CDN1_9BILA
MRRVGRLNGGILTGIKPIVTYGIWTAEGLAVDWLGENLYWVDSLLDQIQVVNFDGTYTATVLKNDMYNLRALALDPSKGLMFWTDWQEENPRIERATMAGNNRQILFNVSQIESGGWPNGLTCDYLAERIYWIDAKSDSVHSITYDGKDHREILRDSNYMAHPFAIVVFENHIYWTDWRSTDIYRANKWNGTGITLVENTSNQPFDLKIVHSSRQPKAFRNPCRDNNGDCSHLCLIESATERRCACPHMMILEKRGPPNDRTRCIPINETLVFATTSTITAIDMDYPNKVVFPLLAGKNEENFSALAVDPKTSLLFWADSSSGKIYKLNMTGSTEPEVLVRSSAPNVYGMAVDSHLGLLYFTSWMKINNFSYSSISVVTLDGAFRKTIVDSKSTKELRQPKDLVLTDGEMYWFDTGYDPPALFKATKDGRKLSDISKNLNDINATKDAASLTFYMKKLFWTQPVLNVTRVLELSSMSMQKVNFSDDSTVAIPALIALDDGGNELIFYDKLSGDIKARMISSSLVAGRISYELRKSIRTLRENHKNIVAMKLMDKTIIDDDEDERGCAQQKCDHICIRSPPAPKCVCADGYNRVGGKCLAPSQRLLFVTITNELFWNLVDGSSSIPIPVSITGNQAALFQPRYIDVDPKRSRLYLIDSKLNEVWSVGLNNTNQVSRLLRGEIPRYSGIAVDPVTGYIYVSSYLPMFPGKTMSATIEVLHPDSEDLRFVVLREQNETITNLGIDADSGYLFWVAYDGIKRCRLDGTDIKRVVSNQPNIRQISIDSKAKKIFYITTAAKTIMSVGYDGGNERKVAQNSFNYDSIVAWNSVLYYTNRGKIYKASVDNKGQGVSNETNDMIGTTQTSIRDIKVYIENDETTNPCAKENGGCQQFCFHIGQTHPKCACVYSKLSPNGKTCELYKTFIAFARGSGIEFAPTFGAIQSDKHLSIAAAIERKDILSAFPPIAESEIIRNPVALAVDVKRLQLIFSDVQANRIVAVKYDKSEYFVVAQDVGRVEGIAFDDIHRDIYFTAPNSIQRVSLSDLNTKNYPKKPTIVLALGELDKPRGIAIDPCRMMIYFTNWRNDMPSIEQVYFSGYQREKIIVTGIQTPNSIAIDFAANKLYWGDARLDKIERADFDGSHREIVVENGNNTWRYESPAHPFGLAIYGDHLYYTDWVHRAVLMINKITGSDTVIMKGNMADQPLGIVVVADDVAKCNEDACTKQAEKLGCEDSCRTTATGAPHCVCHGERQLQPDGKTCLGNIQGICSDDQFMCTSTGRCIPYEETCDGVAECPNGEDEFLEYCAERVCRKDYFSCGNGVCIPKSKRCDKNNDCRNHQDELNCECAEHEFKCKNGMCISNAKRCDNRKDCSDASDEMGCPKRKCSELRHLNQTMINCAYTTQCIVAEWFCDGTNDCWDDWDEQGCSSAVMKTPTNFRPKKRQCLPDEHRCAGTETCIPKVYVCDGSRDCASGSDEESCEKKCDPKFDFMCAADKACIRRENRCNGVQDCEDGSDEVDCNEKCDLSKSFMCRNKTCIPKRWVCDGVDDCVDGTQDEVTGTDEQNCSNSSSTSLHQQCRNSEFQCTNKRTRSSLPDCIPLRHFCDGEPDCWDESDEPNGCEHRQCELEEFRCKSGQCIPRNWTCNGIADCRDESDEDGPLCDDPLKGWNCRPGQFQCENGVCLENANVTLCNLKNDCGDWSDEKRCNANECLRDSPCADICIQKKIGFQCACSEPMVLDPTDNRSCIFPDRCQSEFPCSQQCVHASGRTSKRRYKCLCVPGYQMMEDGKICRHADSTQPEILLINRRYLRVYSMMGQLKTNLLTNLTNGVAVDYDSKTSRIYFSDVSSTGSVIGYIAMNSDGQIKQYKILHNLVTTSPEGIFVDFIGRNIFWCDRDSNAIYVADLNGNYVKALLKGEPLTEPRALVADPTAALLFWTDWGSAAHIGRMNMDGSNPKLIIDTSLRWPNALAVDTPSKRLYWGDAHLEYIGSCDYDGAGRRVVIRKNIGKIFGLSIFENYLYWSEFTNRTVQRAHKVTGETRTTLIDSQVYKPMGIKVMHPLLQNIYDAKSSNLTKQEAKQQLLVESSSHPCSSKLRCDNMCVPANNTDGFTCLCSNGFKPKGPHCIENCNPTEFVCRKTYKCIPFFWKCDGQNDCGDNEDEPATCPPFHCSPGEMQCEAKNLSSPAHCITQEQICDGRMDCPEGDDEKKDLCQAYGCLETQYKCPNTPKCLSLTQICDGNEDCGDGSDEKNCDKPQCPSGNLECGSGQQRRCIQPEHFCDGQQDCVDGSDESERLCANRTCTKYEFRCTTGKCIPLSWQCDGQADCPDKADEQDCLNVGKCGREQFACKSDGKCILAKFKCDKEQDCSDGSDEEDCSDDDLDTSQCDRSKGETPCNDGKGCYSQKEKCDGTPNCHDYSDEWGCPTCSNTTFQCLVPASKCIPLEAVCDGMVDCIDASDEVYCNCRTMHHRQGFKCSGDITPSKYDPSHSQCIPSTKVCDGIPHCSNGHDEDVRVCKQHSCPPTHLRCDSGHCYPHTGFCDGTPDCLDESDEKNDYCENKCKNGIRCDNGICVGLKKRCDGVNDCGDNSDERDCGVHTCITFGMCSQYCRPSRNETKCYCAPGYELEKGMKCRAKDQRSTIALLTDGKLVWQFRTRPSDVLAIERPHMLKNFDYISENGKNLTFYWIDQFYPVVHTGSLEDMLSVPTVRRQKRGLVPVETSVDLISLDLAVDWVHKNIYTVKHRFSSQPDSFAMMIRMANLRNLSNMVEIVYGDLGYITSIAVSPAEGKLYWTVTYPYAAIEISNLDGSNRRPLALEFVYEPTSLVVDELNGRLYWSDLQKGTIESATLSGKDRRIVKKYGFKNGVRQDKPESIDLFEDYLYVVGRPNGTVWRTNKFGKHRPKENEDIVIKKIQVHNQEAKLKIVHPIKRYAGDKENPCSDATVCGTQPCVMVGKNPKCICPEGSFYDGKKCSQIRALFLRNEACGSTTCLNDGVCDKQRLVCVCPPGITGSRCENNPCKHACLNNGTCLLRYSAATHETSVICNCPLEYSGPRCEKYRCMGLCGSHGVCKVSPPHGLPTCQCDIGWSGVDCTIRSDSCQDYCFNGGRCRESEHGPPFCECPPPYRGLRCENCLRDNGAELICRNGGRCRFRKQCECPSGFLGESCDKDLCEGYCINGGICLRNASDSILSSKPVGCACLPGFHGSRCELDDCTQNPNFCKNGGVCTIAFDGKAICACPSKFQGEHCDEPKACHEYCLNESECFDKSLYEWGCKCQEGYLGTRCDLYEKCGDTCENGAICLLHDHGPNCQCPKGLNGTRCNEVGAKSCSEIDCFNGGVCKPETGTVACLCPFGWTGLICNLPTCDSYCENDAECYIMDGRPICKCPDEYLGVRCDQILSSVSREAITPSNLISSILSAIVPVVLIISLALFILYIVIVKNDKSTKRLFQHTRMIDDDDQPIRNMEEFQNPAFLAGDDDGAHASESTHFTNPTFESVYNDTVTDGTLTLPNTEKHYLLQHPLQDDPS